MGSSESSEIERDKNRPKAGGLGTDTLTRLTRWYASQCDGDWEHGEGLKIETLDNPGWQVRVNVAETPLEAVPFPEVKDAYEHETEWLRCWRTESTWEAACGVPRLGDALNNFLDWAERHDAPKQSS
jgi:hypothetical protein